MGIGGARRCPECSGSRWLWGDGKCSGCAGAGKVYSLTLPDRDCSDCGGSGICSNCRGKGRIWCTSFAPIQPRSLLGRVLAIPLSLLLIWILFYGYLRWRYLPEAEESAEEYHIDMSHDKVSRIYFGADDWLRARVTFDSAITQLESIRTRWGECKYSGLDWWGISTGQQGVFVVTRYRGQCASGNSIETLRCHIVDDDARLVSFRVDEEAGAKHRN